MKIGILAFAIALTMTNTIYAQCNPHKVYSEYTMDAYFGAWNLLTTNQLSGEADRHALNYLSAEHWHVNGLSGFSRMNLSNRDFTHINASNRSFHRTNMENTLFIQAQLCGSVIQISNLKGAVFTKAVLANANISGSDASNSIWHQADITDANISNVNFQGAKNLTQSQINSACYLPNEPPSNLPIGLNLPPLCP